MTREAPVSGDRSPGRPGAGNAVDVRGLPKVELHCHLDGLVDPAMLRALRRQGASLPVSAPTRRDCGSGTPRPPAPR